MMFSKISGRPLSSQLSLGLSFKKEKGWGKRRKDTEEFGSTTTWPISFVEFLHINR